MLIVPVDPGKRHKLATLLGFGDAAWVKQRHQISLLPSPKRHGYRFSFSLATDLRELSNP